MVVAAAPPLRLTSLLEEARQRNPEVRAALAQARAAAAAVSPAGALEDPMLMVQYWNGPVDFSTVPIMIQLTQTFPLGGKRGAREDAAAADARATQAEAAAKLRDVEREVTQTYAELFMAERILQVHEETLDVLRKLSSVAADRVAAGRGDVVDGLKARGELLKEQGEHERLVANQTGAGARLRALLAREPDSPLGPTEEPPPLGALAADEVLRARALERRPEVQAARAAVQAAEARVRLASAAAVPDLTPILGYMHVFGAPPQNNFLFLGMQANLPIFGGSKIEPSVSAARARVEAAQALTEALRNKIASQVTSAAAQLRAGQRLVELSRQLIPLARQTLESSLSAYASGRIGLLTVLDSEREALMRQEDLARQLAVYAQQQAELERALGGALEVRP
ncbi:MAG TPA: TolC family protein [Myxococcaceae bacterium]|nr:TolC family protein [Myxococcaceae bacterium]